MAIPGQLFQVIADFTGKQDDPQFLPLIKGEKVRVIKKEDDCYMIIKEGKALLEYLCPYQRSSSTEAIQQVSTEKVIYYPRISLSHLFIEIPLWLQYGWFVYRNPTYGLAYLMWQRIQY
ncbi:MAG: hypothetical protein EZS28_029752 [Streblomastix strix]|uniref:SH3 domain-containing protein n=1 Tax=Streblomastix strix TaxID=222440 RepID=A0A5J4UX39_9EUKA|nr:MAG: hypothetical protein EZS28_029752 [Streblomastix strix]